MPAEEVDEIDVCGSAGTDNACGCGLLRGEEPEAAIPFQHGGATWALVAERLDVGIDGRRCRVRVTTLVKNHRIRVAALEKASGIDEKVTDFDSMLYDISDLMENSHETSKEKCQEKADNLAEAERRGEEFWELALTGMDYKTRKRGLDDEDLLALFRERDDGVRAYKIKELEFANVSSSSRKENKSSTRRWPWLTQRSERHLTR